MDKTQVKTYYITKSQHSHSCFYLLTIAEPHLYHKTMRLGWWGCLFRSSNGYKQIKVVGTLATCPRQCGQHLATEKKNGSL